MVVLVEVEETDEGWVRMLLRLRQGLHHGKLEVVFRDNRGQLVSRYEQHLLTSPKAEQACLPPNA